MDQALKKKWVTALRSGKYAQAQGSLKRGDNFCCLGVLCEVMGYNNWQEPPSPGGRRTLMSNDGYTVLGTGNLSSQLIIESGLDVHTVSELANMNDNGDSFVRIAQHIEETL
jgi:hypothetical protein